MLEIINKFALNLSKQTLFFHRKNMKIIKLFLLTFALFLTNFGNSHSAIFDYGFKESEDYIEITDIENIYAPRRLRKILDHYAKLDLSKKDLEKNLEKLLQEGLIKI